MPTIHTSIEKKRGCGYRKPGGFYLIGSKEAAPCCKLPVLLTACPCCGNRVKFTRGFQWISGKILGAADCSVIWKYNGTCPLVSIKDQRIGLMWVGRAFYSTPKEFENEAARMGVSKRIKHLPKNCKIGSWIALAHMAAVEILPGSPDHPKGEHWPMPEWVPGIFHIFKVTGIDYIVKGTEDNERLEELENQGIRLVKVEREGDPVPMGLQD